MNDLLAANRCDSDLETNVTGRNSHGCIKLATEIAVNLAGRGLCSCSHVNGPLLCRLNLYGKAIALIARNDDRRGSTGFYDNGWTGYRLSML